MIKLIKKYKTFLRDLFINTFSFSIYIIAQQIFFMPIMGKFLDELTFANFVIYISVFSILSNALGSELGIVEQVLGDNVKGNYKKILRIISTISFLITIICLLNLKFNIFDSVMLSIVVYLANYRLFYCGLFRKNRKFKAVFIQNIYYLMGMILGLLVFYKTKIIWTPSLLAEIIANIYSYKKGNMELNYKGETSSEIVKTFASFSFISFLNNLLTYFDKIIIYPILGTLAVNTYYSTTAMSKIVNMITNPLHSVLLTWINKGKDNSKIINAFIMCCIPVILISVALCLPTTYVAVRLLYPQYLSEATKIILPVSLGLGLSVGVALLKSLLLKFIEYRKLIFIYLIYFILFIIISIIMSKYLGIIGFCYATFISKTILFIEFIINLKIYVKNEEE